MPAIPESHRDLLVVANPYRYLEIRGDAELLADDDYAFAATAGAKYGADLREHDQPGEARMKGHHPPVRVNAVTIGG